MGKYATIRPVQQGDRMTLEEFVKKNGLELRTTKVTKEEIVNPNFARCPVVETSFECKCEILIPIHRYELIVVRPGKSRLLMSDIAKFRSETPEEARRRLIEVIKGQTLRYATWDHLKSIKICVPDDLE